MMLLSPSDKIVFTGKQLGEKPISVTLKITNETANRIAFKVKCSSNEMFRIQRPFGALKANESITFLLRFKAGHAVPKRGNHFFSVQHIKAADEQKSARNAWVEHKGEPEGKQRLKVEFNKNDDAEDEKKKDSKNKTTLKLAKNSESHFGFSFNVVGDTSDEKEVSHEINNTTSQRSQLKVAIDEACPICREPHFKAPLTFLIAKDGISDFEALESDLHAATGKIREIASMGYLRNGPVRSRFPGYHIFVCGKWRDAKWVYIEEDEQIDQESQYVVIMSKVEQQVWRLNGATFALSTNENGINWPLSVLATSVFTEKPVFDNKWKRIPSEKEHVYEVRCRREDNVFHCIMKDCATYLEMLFQNISFQPTDLVDLIFKDGTPVRLNDLCTAGDEIAYGKENIANMRRTSGNIYVKEKVNLNFFNWWVSSKPVIALNGSVTTGRSLLQFIEGSKWKFKCVEWMYNGIKARETQKVEGKIMCHFIYGTGADCKAESLWVETGSDFPAVLPKLAHKVGIPLTALGYRVVYFYDGDVIVNKLAVDIEELKEFAAYLIEL